MFFSRPCSSISTLTLVSFKPDAKSLLRFRARRVFEPVRDFNLLAPTDVFLFTSGEAIEPTIGGGGRSLELEYTRTLRDASFLRLGLFQQDLKIVNALPAESFAIARLRGLRARYEGILSPSTTYFLNGDWNDPTGTLTVPLFGTVPNYQLSLVPRFGTEAGLQFLSKNGWFVQPSVAYSGSRLLPLTFPGLPRTRLGGFSVTNIRIGKRSGLRSTVFVEIANVFDKDYVVAGLTSTGDLQPGRQFRAGAAWRF